MYDIFVTHDWRVTPEQEAATLLLDAAYGLDWRNFGTPWHDPAINKHTPDGEALVRTLLEEQVTPARVVLLVGGLHAGSQRGAMWSGAAVALARRDGIPVIGLPPRNTDRPTDTLAPLADVWVPWDQRQLAEAIEAALARG